MSAVRIVVTGQNGQVATALSERAPTGVTVVALGRPLLDLERLETIAPAIAAAKPDVVVNAAAFTAVDLAESEEGKARRVNGIAAGAVARAAAALRVPVIQISTDYVFDGALDRPYREDDETGPISAYGRSKLAGEAAVAAATGNHAILRTAWVYSPFGKNFVRTMLGLAETRDEVSVVADQHGNPTSALDIADGILAAATAIARGGFEGWGTYHFGGSGEATWADLASHVFETSRALGGPSAHVRPISTAEYPTRARRPVNSRLDSARFAAAFGWTAPDWRESATTVVRRLVDGGR